MYGYITPDKSKLYNKDFLLFRAFYCGICKATAKHFGTLPRLTTNYDITFLSVFLHAYLNIMPEFSNENCIMNPFKKKQIAKSNDLLKDITDLNILLAYHNVLDNIIDGGGVKNRAVLTILKKSYKKAKDSLPQADEIIRYEYNRLRTLEKENCPSLDRVSDCFAKMLTDSVLLIIKKHNGDIDNSDLKIFLYNLGKFVFLMDALDDLKDDFKSKNYNPFLAKFNNFSTKEQFINDNRQDIEFAVNITINQAIECFNRLNILEGRDLLSNIVYHGFRRKFGLIMTATKKQHSEKI